MTFNQLKSRRDFLRYGCRTISTIGAASAFGQAGLLNAQAGAPGGYKALVCIFLFGGSDANNMLVPNDAAGYKTYQTVRQNLAIPQASLVPIVSGAAQFGLHPSFAPIAGLYNNPAATGGKLALVANVGTLVNKVPMLNNKPNLGAVKLPLNLYSHSDQTAEWQNGVPQGGATTGWSGRLADKIAALYGTSAFPTSIGITGNALQLNGVSTQPTTVNTNNFGLLGNDKSAASDARLAALQQMLNLSSGVTLIQAAQNSLKSALDVANKIDQAVTGSSPLATQFPNTDIGQQLLQVAKIIQVRAALGVTRQIFFCGQGGYDTHSAQLGQQATLFGDLAGAMAAFDQAMGQLTVQNNVTTFTESEFSRTFQPNGNAGTDHAWGSHALVMGGAVQGGKIYGTFPTLALGGPDDSGNRGNWVPTTATDQYGGALAKWFGVTAHGDLDYVFPNLTNFGYSTLGVLG